MMSTEQTNIAIYAVITQQIFWYLQESIHKQTQTSQLKI